MRVFNRSLRLQIIGGLRLSPGETGTTGTGDAEHDAQVDAAIRACPAFLVKEITDPDTDPHAGMMQARGGAAPVPVVAAPPPPPPPAPKRVISEGGHYEFKDGAWGPNPDYQPAPPPPPAPADPVAAIRGTPPRG